MKANELRIGCNFQLENGVLGGGIATIKNKYDLDVAFDLLESNSIKPIPLTEEWLLKFGLQPNKWFCENSFCIVEDKTGDTHYGWCMKVQNASHTKEIEFGYFKYVHQLQNLYFALTGEELTFKSE